jgi:hypothetical protein
LLREKEFLEINNELEHVTYGLVEEFNLLHNQGISNQEGMSIHSPRRLHERTIGVKKGERRVCLH